jgi:hypothetical protein
MPTQPSQYNAIERQEVRLKQVRVERESETRRLEKLKLELQKKKVWFAAQDAA